MAESKEQKEYARIDDYRILYTLGLGGYAKVVAGKNVKDQGEGKVCAIKITLNQKEGAKILEEAKILDAIGPHKNIVRHFAQKEDGVYIPEAGESELLKTYLVYELCENGTLFDLVTLSGGFDEVLARTYFQQMVFGIEYMHKKNFVHRDLKTENLLLDRNFKLKVADLGLACGLDSQGIIIDRKKAGTKGYMAPEVKTGAYGPSNDVFAMGIILFAFILARPPFSEAESSCPWYKKVQEGDWTTYWMWQNQASGCPLPDAVTPKFKQFIEQFFITDVKDRITVPGIKNNKWFKGKSYKEKKLVTIMKKKAEEINFVSVTNRRDAACGAIDSPIERGEHDSLPNWDISSKRKDETGCIVITNLAKSRTIVRGDGDDEGDGSDDDDEDEDFKKNLLMYEPCVANYTKWATVAKADDINHQLKKILNHMNMDYTQKDNYLLEVQEELREINLVIQIFKTDNEDNEGNNILIVEFGRRMSVNATFRQTYVTIRSFLEKSFPISSGKLITKTTTATTTTSVTTTTTTTTTTIATPITTVSE